MKYKILPLLLILVSSSAFAQPYDRQDSLRGSITPERSWWDLTYYDLEVAIDIDNQSISGSNTIFYQVLKPHKIMQIDLQPPMEIRRITQDGKDLTYERDGNACFITLDKAQTLNSVYSLKIEFQGVPRVAPYPPWDSGMVWEKDSLGRPFAASVSWGAGSSQWWPCKDHHYDEVDSMKMSFTVAEDLVAVGNGRLQAVNHNENGTKTYQWFVSNPINTYGVNFNIGNYAFFSETYEGLNGPLTCSYYVLDQNLTKAKRQFKQVSKMLDAFEYWFGPYPFYEDGYKLVEVPYLGMEHQSATAYGNDYQDGYKETDLSKSGWGEMFDYIIIHESGHEWFACNISFKDIADIWIHESFTTYSEGLYVEYHFGKEAGNDYQIGIRKGIRNTAPIIGDYGIHDLDYTDVYNKGAVVLHMLRQIIDNDAKWRSILQGLNQEFYHQTVTTKQIEEYISEQSGINLRPFWDQYLRTAQTPILEYYLVGSTLSYRWTNCIPTFDMPVKVRLNGDTTWLAPNPDWQELELASKLVDLVVDRNFYVPAFFSNSK